MTRTNHISGSSAMHTRILLTAMMLAVLAAIPSCSSRNDKAHTSGQDSVKVQYTCPMHPSVISDHPGACPVCGMDLVKKVEQKEMSASEAVRLQHVSLSPTQRVMANVAVEAAARVTFSKGLDAVGVIDFAEPLQAVVTTRFRGRIEKLHANFTGAAVRKGQPLFDLYSPDLVNAQQDYLLALGALTRAQQAGSGGAADMQQELLQSARTRLRTHYGFTSDQIAELEKRGSAKAVVTYQAPISGTVIRKQVIEGQYVDEGTGVYQLADLSRVWAYLEIPEQSIRYVRAGQKAEISADAFPGEMFRGSVTFVDPVMNSTTRTVRARVELANTTGKLRPQMYVRGTIGTGSTDALAVPASAVITTGTRAVVWVEVAQNEFAPRAVTTGVRTGDRIEITSGLDEGEMIVVSGGYLLDSESQLRGGDQGAASGNGSQTGQTSLTGQTGQTGAVKTVTITVDNEFIPATVTVKKGEKVRLLFRKVEDSECTNEVQFKDFGIRKSLPAFKTTAVELTPTKAGSFRFSCGMNMVHGTLVVR